MKVFILGAGKVGRALAHAIRAVGWQADLRAARRGLPRAAVDADLVVLAVRDRDLAPLASALAEKRLVPRRAVCVHVSGALDAAPLVPLRAVCGGIAQMHPMISFASLTRFPGLARGNVRIEGDPRAVARARSLARKLGMTPRTISGLDTVGYHAAAGLVANGAAALAAVGAELLVLSGVSKADAPRLLGPLLRSVAENVEALGFPSALTGPVRRGDAAGLAKHLATLRVRLPSAVALFLASARAQLPLARALADAPPEAFVALESWLEKEEGKQS